MTAAPAVFPCCEPTIVACPTLTMAATPDPSKAGAPVRISGRLSTGAAGATVTLWQQPAGKTTLQQVAQTTTDATGAYSFTRPAGSVKTNRDWFAETGAGRGAVLRQRVSDAISFSWSLPALTIAGKVVPSHAGETIRFERRIGRAWVVIGKARLTNRSTFRVTLSVAGANIVLRAFMRADARNVASYSATLKAKL